MSTADVCKEHDGRGFCGRRSRSRTKQWADTTCEDCHAARRADEAVTKEIR